MESAVDVRDARGVRAHGRGRSLGATVGERHRRHRDGAGFGLAPAAGPAALAFTTAPLSALRTAGRADLTDADRWILGRLEEVRAEVDSALDAYEFNRACESLYHFAWDEFCDWYVELAKVQLGEGISGTTAVLATVLDALLKLLHPVMPFVTETLWKALTGEESVVIAAWPQSSGITLDTVAAQRIDDMQKLVTEVRRFRSDQGLADRQKVPARLSRVTEADLLTQVPAVTALAWLTGAGDGFAPTASIEVRLSGGTVLVEVDTSGTVDVAAERRRLEKDLAVAQKEMAGTTAKLGNEAFVAKAPDAVIAKEREKLNAATLLSQVTWDEVDEVGAGEKVAKLAEQIRLAVEAHPEVGETDRKIEAQEKFVKAARTAVTRAEQVRDATTEQIKALTEARQKTPEGLQHPPELEADLLPLFERGAREHGIEGHLVIGRGRETAQGGVGGHGPFVQCQVFPIGSGEGAEGGGCELLGHTGAGSYRVTTIRGLRQAQRLAVRPVPGPWRPSHAPPMR